MTATTTAIDNDKKGTQTLQRIYDWGVMAATICLQGTIAVRDPSTGWCKGGVAEVGAIALGFFGRNEIESVDGVYDNSAGVSGGEIKARIIPGTRKLQNSTGGDALTIAHRGLDCFIVDNQTVALTSNGGTRSIAGKVIYIDTDGVDVEVGLAHAAPSLAAQGAQAGTAVAVAGVVTVGGAGGTISITANSRIVFSRKTKGGTPGLCYDAPSADRVVGGPGVGSFKIRAYSDSGATAQVLDTSSFDWDIIG